MATDSSMRVDVRRTGHGLAVYPPGTLFGPRVMYDYEFVWIVDGDVTWHCDGQDVAAPAGTLLLARPGMQDAFTWDREKQTRHAFVHFTMEGQDSLLPATAAWPLAHLLPPGDVLRPMFRHVLWLLDQSDTRHDALAADALLYMVRAFVVDAVQCKGEGRAALPVPVERALQDVQARWRSGPMVSPPLAELAAAVGVSEAHLCRLFKESLGQPPIRTLLYLRLERAATLLARTNLRLQEIADITGFANQFHFSRCFREVFGQSPRDFRRNLADSATTTTPTLLTIRRATSYIWDPL